MLLSLYDFKNVCKLKFVRILLLWECISLRTYLHSYSVFSVPCLFPLSCIDGRFIFPLLYVLSIDLIVFPLLILNPCGCRIDFCLC